MASIKPFRAIRPTRDKAHLVVTRPASNYKENVLKAKLETNPYTFIRIIHPEFDIETPKSNPNTPERFKLVKEKYIDFLNDEILLQDHYEHIYLYKQTTLKNEFLGIIAGASVAEYQKDLIKKHEATLTSRESMFTEYLDIVGYNAEPVLLSYTHHPILEDVYAQIMANRPEYEFSTTDRIKHELWILSANEQNAVIHYFKDIDATYIADGHHRSASSSKLAGIRKAELRSSESETEQHFLAFFMDEKRINILEFNRLITHINNLSPREFLDKLSINFEVRPLSGAQKPTKEHHFTMNLNSDWYLLVCKPHLIQIDHPVSCLDPEILTQYILDPILGIKDLKTDTSIEFIPGNLELDAISSPIAQNKAMVGFVLYPLTMDQVKRVADKHLIMPPKSTWVEPKLRSGLTIYEI